MSDDVKKTFHRLQSALSIYKKYENNQLQLSDIERDDLHFNLKTGADILIEEHSLESTDQKLNGTAIHSSNPFKFDVKSIHDWSLQQAENFDVVIQNYIETQKSVVQRYGDTVPTFKPYFEIDDHIDPSSFVDHDEILRYCKERIYTLRKTDDSFEAYNEIVHRRQNCFDILFHKCNRNIEDPMMKLYMNDLSLTNQVTVLQSVKEHEAKTDYDKITGEPIPVPEYYEHVQRQYTIGECIEFLRDRRSNDFGKSRRPIVMGSTSGRRLVGEEAYLHWSGLQVFDLDLKFSPSFNKKYETAAECRDILFNYLKRYPWLIGITLSASGRGLHIYTKVSRMHHIFREPEANIPNQKFWYRMSYIQKHAAIAYCLHHFCEVDIYNEDKVIDTALARVGQGIAMNYDPEARWSSNFVDLYPTILYHIPPVPGINIDEWLTHPKILQKYVSWFYDHKLNDEEDLSIQKHQGKLQMIVDNSVEINNVKAIDMLALEKGDRYTTRWRIVNTIISAFGDTEQSRQLCHHILQSAKTNSEGNINSFIRSAVVNRKEADVYTIQQLRKLGVKIQLEEESQLEVEADNVQQIKYHLETVNYDFQQVVPDVNIKLYDDEFLGMQMRQVLSSMRDFKVNVIESAPNTGKTEFFKTLAKTATVCLVIPFTSTIESKIVADEEINKLFDVYYGDKKISELKPGRSAVMTFDKFSSMPTSKYELFKYIAIDESHLLFTSTYRLTVVSKTIENIRNYLLKDMAEVKTSLSTVMSMQNMLSLVNLPVHNKSSVKFIMMSGTLTGEIDYMKHYGILHYIKVHKRHPHKKTSSVILTRTAESRDIQIFYAIKNQLAAGGKVIHPTNKGDAYAKMVVDCVEELLGRKIKSEYYKRANTDEQFLQEINTMTTVNDIELLFCSDYLSVGIDIKDTHNFITIFANDFTAESIEQFNNRLRSTDIQCKIFYDILDQTGMQKANIINTRQVQYVNTPEFAKMIEDELAIAKLQKSIDGQSMKYAVLDQFVSKYFIPDMAGNIKYIRAAFEIEQFELQYTVIAKSLLYVKSALSSKYGYDIEIELKEESTEDTIDRFDAIKSGSKREHDLMKTQKFIKLVDFLCADDVYSKIKDNEVIYLPQYDDLEPEDDGLYLGYDQNRLDGTYVIYYDRSYKSSLGETKQFVRNLRPLYSHRTSNEIVQSTIKSGGLINKKDLKRYQNLMKLLFADKKNTISLSTKQLVQIAYDTVSPEFDVVKIDRFDYEELKIKLKTTAELEFIQKTEHQLSSVRRQEKMHQNVMEFIDTLFKKTVSKDTVTLRFRRIFPFDSSEVQRIVEQDKIFRQILLNLPPDQKLDEYRVFDEQHLAEPIAVNT